MSIRPHLTIVPDQNATPSLKLALAEEVRELRKLAMDRRAASLVLFRNSSRHRALPRNNVAPRGRGHLAA
jgi:hypothetical protein